MRAYRINRYLALVACVAVMAPGLTVAQQYFDPGLIQRTFQSKPEDFTAPGARVGSFMFHPGVELIAGHNDNVFYTPEAELGDTLFLLRPQARLASDWNNHALNLSGWAELARHQDQDAADYDDWGARLDGRVDARHDSWLSYEASYMQLHEDRRTPDDLGGVKPTEFNYSGIGVGYDHVFNRLKAGFYYRQNSFDYDNNRDGEGAVIDNQDRDRTETQLTLRVDYQWMPQRTLFLSYAIGEVDYDLTPDSEGVDRNADRHSINAGIKWDISGVLSGDLFASWVTRDYDDPALGEVDGFALGAGLNWTPTQKTLVNLRLAGSPQETTQDGASGYFSRLYSVRLQHELRRNLLFNARASYTTNDYELYDLSNNDALDDTEVTRAGVGLTYLFNRNLYLSGGYTWENQDANNPLYEYSANRVFLTLGLEF